LVRSKYDILIIDDSKYIIDLLEKILRIKGYSCKSVGNTSEAFEELKINKPQLILLDVHLPQLSGYEFCDIIKSNKQYKNILVYYFSGVPEAEVAIKTLETKADGFIKKPFDLSDFDDLLGYLKPKYDQ
jgi:CheY-like chemotaxis protein